MFVIADLADRWRDHAPVLWTVAGACGVLWLALLAVLAARSEPRRVDAAPATLDLGGPEPPAVVNLITTDWELGHEAIPATLLDLGARGFISIDWLGGRTLVRTKSKTGEALTDYEEMVFDHVRALSTHTADGFVPAEALTTGPDATAKNWWSRFAKGVHRDARSRGLSAARWSGRARTTLVVAGAIVAIAVGIAATTLPKSKSDEHDNPLGAAVALGGIAGFALAGAAGKLRGERDTPAGRAAAARWLGLRTMLADDPVFAEQPPAAINVWDRMLAQGAALGVARQTVAALPLGAESERQAWSSVGGRWRVVRVRYPRVLPPGYGRHPSLVAFIGLIFAAAGAALAPASISAARSLLDEIAHHTSDNTTPQGARIAVGIVLAFVVAFGVGLALIGLWMLVNGVGDLVRGRAVFEGQVLRLRVRGDDKKQYWHLAVDDGSSSRVRAWRLSSSPPMGQGAIVTARVSRSLCHVKDLQRVDEREAAPASAALPPPLIEALDAPAAPPPPLPDAAAASVALGRPIWVDAHAPRHPLALGGASVTFAGDDGTRVVAAWVRPDVLSAYRYLPHALVAPVPGVGDEAYRAPLGGGLVARAGDHVLLLAPHLPHASSDERDRVAADLARETLRAVDPTA